jgi:hypothetical protein
MKKLIFGLLVTAAMTTIAVPMAVAGGNADSAHACQQNGWQSLVRQDGTGFKNTGDCVSYAAQGGTLKTKPTVAASTPGSENFSAYVAGSQPTTFAWGTIDPGDYAPGVSTLDGGSGGSILVSGPYFNAFSTGITHFLFTGWYVNTAKVTFNNPVQDLQDEAMSNKTDIATHLTLTGYDAAGQAVATDSGLDAGYNTVSLHIHSSSANIKYFTVATDDPNNNGASYGLGFSNIVWS